jgi:signal transduction histidine kinase
VTGDDDIRSRLLVELRDFAAMRIGQEAANRAFDASLAASGCPRERALDPTGWVPLDVFRAVADALRRLAGDGLLTDAVAWTTPNRRDLSAMSLSAFATPAFFYRHLDRARGFFARHVRFEVDVPTDGRAEVRLTYKEGLERHVESCQIAKGVLHGVPQLFDLPPAEVVEKECWAKGAEACVYEVRWAREAPLAGIGLVAGLAAGAMGWLATPTPAWVFAPLAGWMVGRELRMRNVRRLMTRVSEEQRRVLGEDQREFQRRFDEIKRLNDELEARVQARTKELEAAMKELAEKNASLQRTVEQMETIHAEVVDAGLRAIFGNAVRELAHEIRNPMSTVLANLQLVQTPKIKADEEEMEGAVKDIQDGVDRIRSVVQWFLEVHQTDGDRPVGAYDVAGELTKVVSAFTKRFGTRIKVKLEAEPATVQAHGKQLTQVWVNLLANAGEALDKGTVKVTSRREDGKVTVRVHDDGPGVPAENLPRIFERGFTTKGKKNGSGLGLYISRTIVEKHGGRMFVESAPGQGATFVVELPA